MIHPPPKSTSRGHSTPSQGATDGLDKVQAAIRSLTEPLQHALDEVDVAQAAWHVLTPYHHLITLNAEVVYLSDEWKSYRQLCLQMEERLQSKRRRRFRGPSSDHETLARLRAQLAAVDIRLNVLEEQRKSAATADVTPSDLVFAANNLKAAQEWAMTLQTELDALTDAESKLQHSEAA